MSNASMAVNIRHNKKLQDIPGTDNCEANELSEISFRDFIFFHISSFFLSLLRSIPVQ